jgi:hypothetical protein
MPTWSTRYVKLRAGATDVERLKKTTGLGDSLIQVDAGGAYASVPVATPSLQPDDLAQLSRDFGEAFSIQVHSVADLIVYDHFREGERARGLTYAGEAGWIRVFGTPEPWEAPFFFAQSKLDALLAELEEECSDEAVLARDSAELKRLFAGGKLEEGNARPAPQWRPLAQAIAKHYGVAEPSPGSVSSMRLPARK